MATYTWSDLIAGNVTEIDPFDPGNDVLQFDTISAADLMVDSADGSTTTFSDGSWIVTIATGPYSLTATNVTFLDGSKLIVGDNNTGSANDDAANTIVGGTGNDLLVGAGGADSVLGASGADTLAVIGAAADGVYGNDTLNGGANDTLTGEGDTLVYLDAESGVTVELSGSTPSTATGGDGVSTLTLLNIENVIGTGHNDSIVGSNVANLIDGGAGSDTLSGGNSSVEGANDTLVGGGGDDWLRQTRGSDVIDGGDGLDRLFFGSTISGGVVVDLNAGTSSFSAGAHVATLSSIERVSGTSGNDHLTASSNTEVNGLASDVTQSFTPGAGDDTIVGATGDGRNTFVSYSNSSFAVNVDLGAGTALDGTDSSGGGTDTFDYTSGANIDIVSGSGFADVLTGGGPATGSTGGSFEQFEGNAGSDTIDGMGGDDQVRYQSSPFGVVVNLGMDSISGDFFGTGVLTVEGGLALDGYDSQGGSMDWLFNIEHARGSEFNDTLVGGSNDHRFEGLGGDDYIAGGVESFTTASYQRSTEAVYVNLEDGVGTALADTVTGGTVGVDTLVNISSARGSDYADYLVGGGVGEGADSDFFEFFDGGAGDDTIDGDGGSFIAGNDATSYARAPSAAIVNLGAADVVVGSETVAGGTANDGYGVNGNPAGIDTLINIEAAEGSRFADTLVGGDGDELFMGGEGDDSIGGGAGTDTVVYESSPQRVIVNLHTGGTLTVGTDTVPAGSARDGFGTTDTLAGIEDVIGSAWSDFIRGSNAANVLMGEDGNDSMYGGASGDTANDTIFGGTGDDWIRQTQGADYMDGGTGTGDRLVFNNSGGTNTSTGITYGGTTGVHVDLGAETADYDTSDGLNPVGTVVNIEGVWGTAGDDVLTGGSLARSNSGTFLETFRGGVGNDTIDGAGGGFGGSNFTDRVEFENINNTATPDPVVINLGASDLVGDFYGLGEVTVSGGTALDGWGGTDTLLNVDWVVGTEFNDTMVGNDQASGFERFQGMGGDDYIDGRGGDDEVSYQNAPGAVTVDLGAGTGVAPDGTDTLISIKRARGSSFGDSLVGGANDEMFTGEGGNDTIDGGGGLDFASWQTLSLASGGISVFIENGGGVVSTQQGTDTLINIEGLVGSNSDDTLTGGAGDQWFRGRGGSDVLDGGEGAGDTADYSTDPNGVIVDLSTNSATDGWGGLHDLQGNDQLFNIENVVGSRSNDHITGDGNSNILDGGAGSDTLDGGGGSDTALYTSSSGVEVSLAGGFADDGDPAGADALVSIENITGGDGGDVIAGDGNANVLDGGAGNDLINGGASDDTLIGGTGSDTLDYSDSPNRVIVNMFGTTSIIVGGDTVSGNTARDGHGTTDSISGFDNAIGSDFNDYIQAGSTTASLVQGGDGNDTLGGGGGMDTGVADTLLGGAGDDALRQSRGQDNIDGGDGANDRLEFVSNGITYGGTTAVLVNLGDGTSNADANDTDTVTGAGADVAAIANVEQVFGTAGDDTLVGGSLVRSQGGAFQEVFRGGAGDDLIDGGNGGLLSGLSINDRAEYSSSPGGVIVNLGSADVVVGATTVTGGTASDGFGGTDTLIDISWVRGSNHDDTLVGGDGSDILEGTGGNDSLVGGAGLDEARYNNAPGGVIVNLGAGDLIVGSDTVAGGTAMDGFGGIDTLVSIERARGGASADYLKGSDDLAVQERFTGSEGDDTIDGGAGVDFASWGAGGSLVAAVNAFIENGSGTVTDPWGDTDILINIEGMEGTHLNDTLSGGEGGQWFRGRGGNDVITGGNGIDTVDYSIDPYGVVVDLSANTAADGWGGLYGFQGTDTLSGVENVVGSGNDDSITGDGNSNMLDGRGGSDTLNGGAGIDAVTYATAASGVTVNLLAGTGNDGADTDILSNIENVLGSGFADQVTGDNSANNLSGNAGNDSLDGGLGADTLVGGGGADLYFVNSGTDVVLENPGEGIDEVFSTSAAFTLSEEVEILTLGAGNINGTGNTGGNVITGGTGDNRLAGLDGNDTLNGGAGVDTLFGGANDDTYVFSEDIDLVKESASSGTDLVVSAFDYTLAAQVEDLTLTGTALAGTGNSLHNFITGNDEGNTLTGGSGIDTLVGGDDNDTLLGGLGADSMVGGDGDDFYSVNSGVDAVLELLGEGLDEVQSTAGFVLPEHFEILTLAGTANVNGTGNSGHNALTGNTGNNRLVGNDGNDTLNGGVGADTLIGGKHDDTYIFVHEVDLISNEGSALDSGTDLVLSGFDYTLVANVENLTLTGTALVGTGNTLNNIIVGNNSGNTLSGDAGHDTLDGGGGSDTLMGGDGNDSLDGGLSGDVMQGGIGDDAYVVNTGADVVSEGSTAGTDSVFSSVTFTLPGNVENLTLTDTGNINGTGSVDNNVLTGNAGINRLSGLDGNDTLAGGLGADTLLGGNHDDTLIWDSLDAQANGGAGTDTLRVLDSSLNLATLAGSTIQGMEVVDLVSGSVNATLTLALADVLAMSTTTDTLTINGDGSDTLNATDAGSWTFVGNDGTYNTFTQGGGPIATLVIDQDININIVV